MNRHWIIHVDIAPDMLHPFYHIEEKVQHSIHTFVRHAYVNTIAFSEKGIQVNVIIINIKQGKISFFLLS